MLNGQCNLQRLCTKKTTDKVIADLLLVSLFRFIYSCDDKTVPVIKFNSSLSPPPSSRGNGRSSFIHCWHVCKCSNLVMCLRWQRDYDVTKWRHV